MSYIHTFFTCTYLYTHTANYCSVLLSSQPGITTDQLFCLLNLIVQLRDSDVILILYLIFNYLLLIDSVNKVRNWSILSLVVESMPPVMKMGDLLPVSKEFSVGNIEHNVAQFPVSAQRGQFAEDGARVLLRRVRQPRPAPRAAAAGPATAPAARRPSLAHPATIHTGLTFIWPTWLFH